MFARPRPPFSQIIKGGGKSQVFVDLLFIPPFDRRLFALKLHTIRFQSTYTKNFPNMATSNTIHLTPDDTGVFKFGSQDSETAKIASQLLQENHDKHHIFFNETGFHNHIVHHLLTLYGLGAPASVIERQYKLNASYQRPVVLAENQAPVDMSIPDNFHNNLGKQKYYHDFLVFWQRQIEIKGWRDVLKESVFAGDSKADDMLGRMFAGFLHPLIHLGFGIEFNQPAIIAEALAQASVHDMWITKYLLDVEKKAQPGNKTIPQLLDEIRDDKKLSTAAEWDDGNKIRDGILARAADEMMNYASQWTVGKGELEAKTAQMISSAVYFAAAAQRPPKQVKFDFYYMHCVNSSIFFTSFNKQDFLSEAQKVRLLEWKGRFDLTMYASRRSPELLLEEISGYVPKLLEAGDAEWSGLFHRLFEFEDDGHAVKLGRTVAHAEVVSQGYEDQDWAKIKSFMWLKIGNMVADSVEDTGDTWARSVGFDEAWKDYVDRPRQVHL
ncbi:putative hypa-like protein [Botrytis fragariae]|uniref:Putative hypa-like protein n=1 Tax=Botrytis fragariae TaxID=1964551 RepID=A0A8H6AVC1_9HELO|nr:putative hypa-like protein [Botrytis fragariae]KAF5874272.1 putative hypa-like protein [Botrytis fragariae]